MEDFERRYWRLRRVVYELVEIVAGIVGLGSGWLAYHITKDQHWPSFFQWCATVVAAIAAGVFVKKTCDLTDE